LARTFQKKKLLGLRPTWIEFPRPNCNDLSETVATHLSLVSLLMAGTGIVASLAVTNAVLTVGK
jgi:hypothetical protein